MNVKTTNNRRIAKNTLYLYVRMIFVMLISLYTVRIVLEMLGVEDYGIYNVVAGLVTMIDFISQSLLNTTQRFYNSEMNDKGKLRTVFSTSMIIFLIISFFSILLLESIGLWFLNNKLIISESRIVAANWIYQLSICTLIVTLITIPYSAAIIAHEDINIYAIISVASAVFRLIMLFLIVNINVDKLILYGFLNFIVNISISFYYIHYARRKYYECVSVLVFNKDMFLSMFSFSSWSILGSSAGVALNQGNNILINIFFGPIVNSAKAISSQVSNILSSFSSNFFMAVRPQIIKSYAEKDYDFLDKLFLRSNKFSYFLLILICIPVIIETKYILSLWLTNVTVDMISFTRLTLIQSIILSLNIPITAIIHATGKIKNYNIFVEITILLSLPVSYVLFKYGYSATASLWAIIIFTSIAHSIRLILLQKIYHRITLFSYIREFLVIALLVTCLAVILPIIIYLKMDEGFIRFFLIGVVYVISLLSNIYVVALNKEERFFIINYLQKKYKK